MGNLKQMESLISNVDQYKDEWSSESLWLAAQALKKWAEFS